jgi:hypothetical protein
MDRVDSESSPSGRAAQGQLERLEAERGHDADRAEAIGHVIGEPTTTSGSVVKVTLGRDASMHGTPFGRSMGLTTWAAFTGHDELALMDGDFAMTAEEVQPVLRALRGAGIHVVALRARRGF